MSEPAKTRALIYTRVSSHGQRDNHSLPTQQERCLSFAQEQGWTIVDVVEEVHTATELERPRLAELRNRVAAGESEVVLVHTQDRLSRNDRQLNRLLDELDEVGAEVWSVLDGPFGTDAFGRFKTNVFSYKSAAENEDRTERSMRGQRARVESGKMLGSSPKPTYGYRWPDERRADGRLKKERYDIEPDDAAVVRRIYEAVLAGVPLRAIAVQLNSEHIPSPYACHGKYQPSGFWRHQTLKRLVSNSQYKGEMWALAQRRPIKGKKETKRKRHVPVQLPKGVVPALVSEGNWNRAQEIVAGRRVHRRGVSNPEEVLLRGGIVRCGNCGRAMRLAKRPSGHRYYQCNKMSSEAGACTKPSPSIKTSYVEEPVWQMVRSVLLEPTKIWDRFHSREQRDQEEAMLAELESRRRSVEQRRSTLLRNLELLDDADALEMRPRLDALATERDGLGAQIDMLQRRITSRNVERDRVTRLLNWARDEVQRVDQMTAAQKRAVLLELGVVVRVFPSTAPERYTVELGAKLKPTNQEVFSDIDWSNVDKPTMTQRRETARLFHEATERGQESDLVGTLLIGSDSVNGHHTWDYWDEHVQTTLKQHARVFGFQLEEQSAATPGKRTEQTRFTPQTRLP